MLSDSSIANKALLTSLPDTVQILGTLMHTHTNEHIDQPSKKVIYAFGRGIDTEPRPGTSIETQPKWNKTKGLFALLGQQIRFKYHREE